MRDLKRLQVADYGVLSTFYERELVGEGVEGEWSHCIRGGSSSRGVADVVAVVNELYCVLHVIGFDVSSGSSPFFSSDTLEEIQSASSKVGFLELPHLVLCPVLESALLHLLHLVETVHVELSDERGEFVVLEPVP